MDLNKTQSEQIAQNNRLLKAVLAVLMHDYDKANDSNAVRSELFLAERGLDYRDIAEVLSKKPDAVRMLLKRNKPPKS